MKLKHTRFKPLAFVRDQLRSPFTHHNPSWNLVRGWLAGYSSEQVVLIGQERLARELHLPDALKYRLTVRTNRHVWPILHDKLQFDRFMRGRLPITPMLRALIDGQDVAIESSLNFEALLDQLDDGAGLVVKPLQGGGGNGLLFIVRIGLEWRVNRETLTRGALDETLVHYRSYHGVYRLERQHPSLSRLFPHSVNTLRIFTFVDEESGPKIAACRLRIGTAASWPVDSRNKGGLVGFVNLQSGVVEQTLARKGWKGWERVSTHPDSGEKIDGLSVPHWGLIRDALLGFLDQHRVFDYVGWDVLITDAGFSVIEANHNPGPLTMDMFEDPGAIPGLWAFFLRKKLV